MARWVGGPMFAIRNGLGRRWAWLGTTFAIFGGLAGFGIGNMVQANSIAAALETSFGVAPSTTGVVLLVLTGAVVLGGIRRIAAVSNWLVPFMAVGYIVAALIVLVDACRGNPEGVLDHRDQCVHTDGGGRRLRRRGGHGRRSVTVWRAASSRTKRGSGPPASRRLPG